MVSHTNSAWYTPAELAKRTAIFHFTAAAGSAFAGNLQAAVYTTWNGVGGLAGWRWLFRELVKQCYYEESDVHRMLTCCENVYSHLRMHDRSLFHRSLLRHP